MYKNQIYVQNYKTPAGSLIIGSIGSALCLCDWEVEARRGRIDRRLQKAFDAEFVLQSSEITEKAVSELEEYFAGLRRKFEIPVETVGTDFQKSVWNKLLAVQYGDTISYAELACRLGCPKSVRAVANANGANAVSIFIPCHRIIGSDNSLVGYGGGLDAKRILLELEKRNL